MKKIDIVGQRFGKLIVKNDNIEIKTKYHRYVDCICDCGNSFTTRSDLLRKGITKSCGCIIEQYKIGDKLENFEIIAVSNRKEKGRIFLICRCNCGNLFEVRNTCLKIKISCGCMENLKRGNKNAWKGIGEISKTFWSILELGAIKRKYDFNITIEYVWELYEKQNRKCALTGEEIFFSSNRSLTTASLDRIDNDKGYIEGNVQWVHKHINMMKGKFGQEAFIRLCKLVSQNN